MWSKASTAAPWFAAVVFLGVVGLAFVGAVAAPGRSNHDFQIYLDAGQRLLNQQPAYQITGGGANWFVGNQDLVGPPFQGLFFVPLARLAQASFQAASVVWDAVSLLTLVGGLWLWIRALEPALPGTSSVWRSYGALAAILTVAVPVYANFRDGNTTDLIFFFVGAAAFSLSRERDGWAGCWIGVATALKAFPGLLILYLLLRGRWRAAAFAVATAAGLTLLLLPLVGWTEFLQSIAAWLAHSSPDFWPRWSQNQSLALMAYRLIGPPLDSVVVTFVSLALLLLAAAATRKAPRAAAGAEVALLLSVAVLLSPIAWNHYWILTFGVATLAWEAAGPWRIARRTSVVVAAVLLTVLSRLTLGDAGAEVLRFWSHCTVAGLLLTASAASALLEGPHLPSEPDLDPERP